MGTLLQDVRYGLRMLVRNPGFTAVAVLTLALGIGANSAVFSAIDAVLLRPLPFPDGDELMRLEQVNPRAKGQGTFVAPVRLEDWNRMNTTFQAIAGYYAEDESETSGALPEKLTRALVTPRFLQVLGVSPVLGRDFSSEEERFGGTSAVLISDRFWRRRFGADPNVVGKKLKFGAESDTVIGVMPASFLYPDRGVDLWSAVPMDAPYAQSRESTWFATIGRLKPGVAVAQALADLQRIQKQLGAEYPKTDRDLAVQVEPLKDTIVGSVRGTLWLLFGSVTLLVLIVCTNIAALLLARATRRHQEIAIRGALGASRRRIVVQLLTEAFLLAAAGAALGLVVAGSASERAPCHAWRKSDSTGGSLLIRFRVRSLSLSSVGWLPPCSPRAGLFPRPLPKEAARTFRDEARCTGCWWECRWLLPSPCSMAPACCSAAFKRLAACRPDSIPATF